MIYIVRHGQTDWNVEGRYQGRKDVELNSVKRGDFIALRSAGAYGEVMASQYNCRKLPKAYFSDKL